VRSTAPDGTLAEGEGGTGRGRERSAHPALKTTSAANRVRADANVRFIRAPIRFVRTILGLCVFVNNDTRFFTLQRFTGSTSSFERRAVRPVPPPPAARGMPRKRKRDILSHMPFADEWLEVLEFPAVLEIVASFCETREGAEHARALRPFSDLAELRRAALEVEEAAALHRSGGAPSLADFRPPSAALSAARKQAPLPAAVLRRLANSIGIVEAAASSIVRRRAEAPTLAEFCASLPDLSSFRAEVDAVVDERDRIRDTASLEISRIRRRIADLENVIAEKLRRISRHPEYRRMLQFPEPTFSGERFVMAVKTDSRSRFPGLLHYTSDSGATSFMEPYAVVEITNELQSERSNERAEERRLLARLTASAARNASDMERLFAAAARLDFLSAAARFAEAYRCTFPFVSGSVLHLEEARHPLLVKMALEEGEKDGDGRPREVVPLTLTLGADYRVLVVTGPNTGGKTVALKTVGVTALMALCGLPVPAAQADVPFFDGVYADIGDEQSLEQSLSTFSSHVGRIVRILEAATPRSLVLLDELGSGTDPAEGAALGVAILEELTARRIPAVVTTHIGALKRLAYTEPAVQNAGMEFDASTLEPTYRLVVGEAGESRALQIAARLGMPAPVVSRARELIGRPERAEREAWEELQRIRRLLEKERRTLAERLKEAESDRKEAAALKRELERRLEKLREQEKKAEAAFKPGDPVYVRVLRADGVIERISKKGTATVRVHGRMLTLPLSQLEPPRGPSGN